MKNPKEKAFDIVSDMHDNTFIEFSDAIECAIVAVKEVIIATNGDGIINEYYKQVLFYLETNSFQ